MSLKSLALISTSIVALGFSATASQAAGPMTMGRVDMGFTEWFDTYSAYYTSTDYDYDYPSVTGMARVNIPYSDTVNLQLDVFGDASLDQGYFSGKGYDGGNFGFGGHINYREPDQGLIGIFAAVGRMWDWGYYNSPAVMVGLEGQYYCGHWTFYGQAGWMDVDTYGQQNSGFLRGLVSYYASPRLKLSGGQAYIDGETGNPATADATAWAWEAGGEYWFGKSVPVAVTLRYQGRQSEVDWGSGEWYDLDTNEVTLGVSFFFGGDNLEDADRTGTSTEIPNFDWFRTNW